MPLACITDEEHTGILRGREHQFGSDQGIVDVLQRHAWNKVLVVIVAGFPETADTYGKLVSNDRRTHKSFENKSIIIAIADTEVTGQRIHAGIFREDLRSEEHTSELQSLMRISYAVFCLKKKTKRHRQ